MCRIKSHVYLTRSVTILVRYLSSKKIWTVDLMRQVRHSNYCNGG
uniref:Uncharacterized protein n=1 Tax=Arundo donax TaxID=35708 RepID=A0A0A9CML1_ARUDO